jgi:hypothetical protein
MPEYLSARTPAHSWGEARTLFERWASELAGHDAYLRVGDRPVCSILNLSDFEAAYGLATLQVLLRVGRGTIREILGTEPYLIGVIGQADLRNTAIARALPLDGVTGYGLLPNWLSDPVQDYGRLTDERIADWTRVQERLPMPFFPVVCSGWDATVRGRFRGRLLAAEGYPYSPVVTGVTVARFERWVEAALEFNRRHQPRPPLVFVHAWNEWTEGSVVEPSDRHGKAFLDVLARQAGGPPAPSPPRKSGGPIAGGRGR